MDGWIDGYTHIYMYIYIYICLKKYAYRNVCCKIYMLENDFNTTLSPSFDTLWLQLHWYLWLGITISCVFISGIIARGWCYISLFHLMHVIAPTHASTCTTSLMHVKKCTCHFCLWHLLSRILEWRNWKKCQKHQIE